MITQNEVDSHSQNILQVIRATYWDNSDTISVPHKNLAISMPCVPVVVTPLPLFCFIQRRSVMCRQIFQYEDVALRSTVTYALLSQSSSTLEPALPHRLLCETHNYTRHFILLCWQPVYSNDVIRC